MDGEEKMRYTAQDISGQDMNKVSCSLSGAQCPRVAQESTLYYPNQTKASFFFGTFFSFIFLGFNLTSDKTTEIGQNFQTQSWRSITDFSP